jgi:hypothetical protein
VAGASNTVALNQSLVVGTNILANDFGNQNAIFGFGHVISGNQNISAGNQNTINQGQDNAVIGNSLIVNGGFQNIVGGYQNVLTTGNSYNIVGGYQNNIQDSSGYMIMGGANNIVDNNTYYGALFGGSNKLAANFGIIAGQNNLISGSSTYSAVFGNNNSSSGNPYTIVAGANNQVSAVFSATFGSSNQNYGNFSIVAGQNNIVKDNANSIAMFGSNNSSDAFGTFIFGNSNTIVSNGATNTSVGGQNNYVDASNSLVVGISNSVSGSTNLVYGISNTTLGSADSGFVGGFQNTISGLTAIALGYSSNALSDHAVVIGTNAAAVNSGTFVFADSDQTNIFSGTASDTLYLRFKNGVVLTSGTTLYANHIISSGAGSFVHISGDTMTGQLIMSGASSDVYFSGTAQGATNKIHFSTPSGSLSGPQVDSYIFQDSGGEGIPFGLYISGTTGINLFSNSVQGISIRSTSGTIALNGNVVTVAGSGVIPVTSNTGLLGSATRTFSGVYANQYATTLTSGTGGNVSVNWNSGTSQILNFNGVASGTYTIGLNNGIAGSAYVLKTVQNASGTASIAWSGSQVIWQGGISGSMTPTSGTADLFSFWYDGNKYLGSYSNNYF